MGDLIEYTTNEQLSPYGNVYLTLTKEQIEGLLQGKKYILSDEYGIIIELQKN